MDFSLRALVDTLSVWPVVGVYALLFAGAFLEYVFPPVPGDAVVLAGAILVGALGWNPWIVFILVTLGSALGAAAAFGVGRWWVTSGRIETMNPDRRQAIDAIVRRFESRGALYLAINRFFPGIRALFFVAAGLAGLKLSTTLLWSILSALMWNGLLMGAGLALGYNVDRIDSFFSQYAWAMWGLIMTVGLIVIWRWKRASNNRKSASDQT